MPIVDIKIQEMKDLVHANIGLIEKMLLQTVESATTGKWELAREVIDVLEPQANTFKLEIAQECLGILALYHPEAGDLRKIIKMSGIGGDLERMGDMVTKIAFIAYTWRENINLNDYPILLQMITETHKMLSNVRNAFVEESSLVAVTVIQQDDRVDALRTKSIKALIKEMNLTEDVEPLIQVLNITRHIERMADHCTHFAEDIIFMKEGLVPNKDKVDQ